MIFVAILNKFDQFIDLVPLWLDRICEIGTVQGLPDQGGILELQVPTDIGDVLGCCGRG
jgi:hypothetical protein